jgi:N-acetylglucosaminyldiphosphoundecaprenol N-acetyl-beta-D-mannosaminyltransferase
MSKTKKIETTYIFGIPVHGLPQKDVLRIIEKNIISKTKKYISITSGELMYNVRRVKFLKDFINNAELSLSDSASVSINGFFRGKKINRFTGPKLLLECSRYGANKKWKHFFCGGADGVADLLSEKLKKKYPGLHTVGTYCPPFRQLTLEEEEEMIKTINQSKADILWIGLGVVKQEEWINKFIHRVNVSWVVGVGGAFDYYAGTMQRCPDWVSAIGMEWLYRFVKEPWRYKRSISVFVFAFEGLIESIFGKAPILGDLFGAQIPGWQKK